MSDDPKLPDPLFFDRFPFNIGMRLLAPGDIRPTASQRERYLRFTQLGDPLADDLVDAFRRLPAGVGRAQFETAVERGIDAVDHPIPELIAFFGAVDARPYWVDERQLALASRVSGGNGVVISFTSMAMLSLMGGYLAARADKTLVGTGDLDSMAPRRLAETLNWIVDVTAPGGMDRFATGFKSTLRVRLMHAMVRAGMSRRDDWDYAAWDTPINQSTMAGTMMLFSLGSIVGAQALGAHYSRKEKEALYQFWRYVGFVVGLHSDLLPANERDTWRLLWLQADYEFQPDADSRRLAQALQRAVGPLLLGTSEGPLHSFGRFAATGLLCAYSRLLLGDDNADELGLVNRPGAKAVVAALALANFALGYPRRLVPGAARLRERLGRRNIEALAARTMTRNRGDRSYIRHDRLAGPASLAGTRGTG